MATMEESSQEERRSKQPDSRSLDADVMLYHSVHLRSVVC
jgi:7,8-dihydro-6-hydroxymethylpterin-pyrophosphokinase